jgi:Arginase family
MRFVGFDVVEVSPPYDSPGQLTALLAANLAYEMLALAALVGQHLGGLVDECEVDPGLDRQHPPRQAPRATAGIEH